MVSYLGHGGLAAYCSAVGSSDIHRQHIHVSCKIIIFFLYRKMAGTELVTTAVLLLLFWSTYQVFAQG